MNFLLAAALVVPLLVVLRRPRKRYPPGPKCLPVLGNLFDLPKAHAYEKYAQLSKDLDSDIVYLNAAGTPFIILNSLQASTDLLDKRSAIYSSRYHQTMAYELVEGHRFFAMQPYNDEWRESRRIMVKHLSAPDQTPIRARTRDFVRKSLLPNFLTSPEDFLVHIRNGVGGSIISLAYGLPIKRVNDPWIALADKGMECITAATVPGKYAVDVLPFLKYLPEWFPGASFQREAREGRETLRYFFRHPFETAKKGMADGTVQPSFLSQSLEEGGNSNDEEYYERLLENVGGMFIAGGTDTSVTAVKTFIVALLLYPEVQAKAQAEIDTVIGNSRFPDFDDKPNLPYVNAVVKEVLRWKPTVPCLLGFHTCRPKTTPTGATSYRKDRLSWGTPARAIMHDEKMFQNPSEFVPERFLTPLGQLRKDDKILDPEVVATFGFGRRACPGSTVGLEGLWLAVASILLCFNISPAFDANGEPEVPDIQYLGKEIVLHPEPFKCRITPRSKEIVSLIQSEYDEKSEYV